MKQSLDNKLFLRYPIIYRGRHQGAEKTTMYFGFDFDNGWFNLINDLSEQIEEIAEKLKAEGVEAKCLPKVSQAKQKFGGLRFYMSNSNSEIKSLIEKAEREAARTCERCGCQPAELVNDDGYYHTACSDCFKAESSNRGIKK